MMQPFYIGRIATAILLGYLNLARFQAWLFRKAAGHNYMLVFEGGGRHQFVLVNSDS